MTRERVPLNCDIVQGISIESVLVPMESEETEIDWIDKYFCSLCNQEIDATIAPVPHNLMQCLKFFLGESKNE